MLAAKEPNKKFNREDNSKHKQQQQSAYVEGNENRKRIRPHFPTIKAKEKN